MGDPAGQATFEWEGHLKILLINSCYECIHRKEVRPRGNWQGAIRSRCELTDKWIVLSGDIPRRCPLSNPNQEDLHVDKKIKTLDRKFVDRRGL